MRIVGIVTKQAQDRWSLDTIVGEECHDIHKAGQTVIAIQFTFSEKAYGPNGPLPWIACIVVGEE